MLVALVATAILWRAYVSGSWIDEYWQIWLSGGAWLVLPERLLGDVHPPWFNLAARGFLVLAGGDLPIARVLSLACACLALGAGIWRLAKADEAERRWPVYFLAGFFILAAGEPLGFAFQGDSFRVYPWLIAASGLQSVYLLQLAQGRPVERNAAFIAAVTALSISLHLVHAVGAIAIATASLLCAWCNGARRVAVILAIGTAIGIALDLLSGVLQSPYWLAHNDNNWIEDAGFYASRVFIETASRWLRGNAVPVLAIAAAIARRRLHRRDFWMLLPLPIAAVTWFTLDKIVPLVVDRYLCSMSALMGVFAAAALSGLKLPRAVIVIAAALCAGQIGQSLVRRAPRAGWDAGARAVSQVGRACAGTRVYAASSHLFRASKGTRAAAYDNIAQRFGYERLGAAHGFAPVFVNGDQPIAASTGRCPDILWLEHSNALSRLSPAEIVAAVNLSVSDGTTVKAILKERGGVLVLRSPTASAAPAVEPSAKAAGQRR